MGQRKRHSVMESLANVIVGYGIACMTQIIIFPLFGIHVPFRTNFIMGAIFTVVSLIRSYTIRRVFNRWK